MKKSLSLVDPSLRFFPTAETQTQGNLIKGWDGFLTQAEIKSSHHQKKTKNTNDKDRLFSQSSVRYAEFVTPESDSLDTTQLN